MRSPTLANHIQSDTNLKHQMLKLSPNFAEDVTRVFDQYSFITITGTADAEKGIGTSDGAARKDW